MLKAEDYKNLTDIFGKADVEQLVLLQKYIEATINDRINKAAETSGLIKYEGEKK